MIRTARLLAALLLSLPLLAACQSPGSKASFEIPSLAKAQAQAQADPRFASLVIEAETGRVLQAENADERRHPASLTKLMTLYILFEELEAGRLAMQTPLPVSPHAAAMPATKLGLKPGGTIRVADAIQALTVRSANDVAVVVAEAIAGSEPAFAQRMNGTAAALGLRSTHYGNASGLPDAAQVTSARDVAILARALQLRFPGRYRYFGQKTFVWEGRTLKSTNELLGAIAGVDGMKTGYIRASGYNLVASAKRGSRRVIVVVMGEKSGAARNGHVAALIDEYLPRGGLFAAR